MVRRYPRSIVVLVGSGTQWFPSLGQIQAGRKSWLSGMTTALGLGVQPLKVPRQIDKASRVPAQVLEDVGINVMMGLLLFLGLGRFCPCRQHERDHRAEHGHNRFDHDYTVGWAGLLASLRKTLAIS